MKILSKIIKIFNNAFPIFNRPMAVCAAMCCMAIPFLYKFESISVYILILFAVILLLLCAIFVSKKLLIISVLFLAVCASAVNEFATVKDLETLDGQFINADFTAVTDSYDTGKVHKLTVSCDGTKIIPENSKFSFYYFFDKDIKCGEHFNAVVKLSSLENSDYKMYNFGNSIYMDCKLIEINNKYSNNSFYEKIGNIRRYMINMLSYRFPDEISSILIALNCGDRKYLSDEFYNKVLICGVTHIMVVSGLHISIIIGLIFSFFEKFYQNRYIKSAVSLLLIFAICALCGFTLSVVRAGIMFLFFVLSPVLLRQNDSLNSLGSSVVLILYLLPFSIFSVSFLLSVSATLAVVWVAPFYSNLINTKLLIRNKIGKVIVSVLTVSICALIFTAPISISVFGTFAVLSPLTFLLITFPVTFALEFNTMALVVSAIKGISFLASPLFWVAGICARYIKLIIDNFGILDFLLIDAGDAELIICVCLIIFMILFMCIYKYYKKLIKKRFVMEVKAHGNNLRKQS